MTSKLASPRCGARIAALTTMALLSGALWSAPQQNPPSSSAPRGAVPGLKISILEGEGAVNNVKRRTARDPVIRVTDENDRPVAGAVVTFTLPTRGASGVFANGARSMTILTNSEGAATATGLTPNAVAGDVAVRVSASFEGQTASTTIAQTNVAGAGLSTGATIGIVGAIAAGAAVAAVALVGGDSAPAPTPNPTPTPQVTRGVATIDTGGIRVGAPQ